MLGLIVNCGSSSIKVRLIDTARELTLYQAKGVLLNSDSAKLTAKSYKCKTEKIVYPKTHQEALNFVIDDIVSSKTVVTLDNIDFVAHRIVHGGDFFKIPTVITGAVIEKISLCSKLAPLHNPVGVEAINVCMKLFSDEIPQIAVFDTAFHQTISEQNFRYAIPNNLYDSGIRKYGFHGISYSYSVRYLKEKINLHPINAVMAHLGQGSSVCAVKNGESFYNSMGFGPLSGCMMVERSGDIDPTIFYHMCDSNNISIQEMYDTLNSKSGITAISGKNDIFETLEGYQSGEKDCVLAIEMFCSSVAQYMANAVIALGEKPKQIVFSGGIGENSDLIREKILRNLSPILSGILINETRNQKNEIRISTDDSFIPVYVIPVNEELEIAHESKLLLDGYYRD